MFGDICRGWEPYIIVEVSLSHGRVYILPFYFNENIKSQTITQNKHTSASHKMKRFFQSATYKIKTELRSMIHYILHR